MSNPAEPATREGTVEQALANGREMLRNHPDIALRQAQVILSQDPRDARALRLAAAAHRALGQAPLAERAEMVALQHSNGIPALVAARAALRAGEFGEASRLAAEHLARERDDLAALTLSAESAVALGFSDKAEPILREILRRAPSFDPAQYLLANALMLMDRQQEVRPLLAQMLASTPDDPALLEMLAKAHSDLGDFAAAAEVNERLIALARNPAESWLNYGDSLRFAGRKADSVAAYRKAIAEDPRHGRAWWSLIDLDAKALTADDVECMEQALETRGDDLEHGCNLHFALGMARDGQGKHEAAFKHFAAGNVLRVQAQPYDPGELTEQIDRYLATLAPANIPASRQVTSPTPVFIVGMPRSGSTLLERILGQHSQIEALGELPIVGHILQRLEREEAPEDIEARVASLDAPVLATMREAYLARASERRKTDRPFFVDKLHMNWKHLPLILRMLPEAVVIDLRRDAMDCCWSNYRTLFSHGHRAANDQAHIGAFYRDYVRLTDELRERAPGRIHFARYEDLVDDLEGTVRPLLDAMGLSFEQDLADFHLSADPVATASSEQVRRPLNRSGIGAWRPYEPWLSQLKEALGPLAG